MRKLCMEIVWYVHIAHIVHKPIWRRTVCLRPRRCTRNLAEFWRKFGRILAILLPFWAFFGLRGCSGSAHGNSASCYGLFWQFRAPTDTFEALFGIHFFEFSTTQNSGNTEILPWTSKLHSSVGCCLKTNGTPPCTQSARC